MQLFFSLFVCSRIRRLISQIKLITMETSTLEKQPLRILFLASNPTNAARLHLGKELQEVRNKLAANSFFEIKDHMAIKPDDVIQTIVGYKPHIVHFSGHGQETGELCFEDEYGKAKMIAPDALARLFELVKDSVKCVVVNTCYAEKQAKAIAQYIPVVIGTKKEISDAAAIKFSTGFYTALDPDLSQNSLEKAYKQGQIAIQFDDTFHEELTPILISLAALAQLQIGLNLSNLDVIAINNRILSDNRLDSDYSWYDRGRGQDELKYYDKAILYYSKAIEKNVAYSAAYYGRGLNYDKIKKYELAIADFSKAIECNNQWEMESNLAAAYLGRGHEILKPKVELITANIDNQQ